MLLQSGSLIQLTPGPASAAVRSYAYDAAALHVQRFAAGFHLRSVGTAGKTFIGVLAGAEARVTSAGLVWPPHGIAVVAGGSVADICSLGPAEIFWVEIDDREAAILGETALEMIRVHGHGLFTASVPEWQGIRDALERVLGIPDPGVLAAFLTQVAGVLRQARPRPRGFAVRSRYGVVVRAQTYMAERMAEPVTLQAICASLGCSERTLIYSFSSSVGVSPIAYFRISRLNAVRKRLLEAPGRTSIKEVAAAYGFWHMGHFSSRYKAFFGTTPSASRKAPPAVAL